MTGSASQNPQAGKGIQLFRWLVFGLLAGGGIGLWIALLNLTFLLGLNGWLLEAPGTLALLRYVLLIFIGIGLAAGLAVSAPGSFLWLMIERKWSPPSPRKAVFWMLASLVVFFFIRAVFYNVELFTESMYSDTRRTVILLLGNIAALGLTTLVLVYLAMYSNRRSLQFIVAPFPLCLFVLLGFLGTSLLSRPETTLAAAPINPIPAAAPTIAPSPGAMPSAKVFLLGLDGADWDIIDKLISENKMPNMQRLVERGARGNLKTLIPTKSPAIWTTVATGMLPEEHGINRFGFVQMQNTGIEMEQIDAPSRLGFGEFTDVAQSLGLIRKMPLSSSSRRVPALWNMLSMAGKENTVIGWWTSWPAEPVNGIIVSDRVSYSRLKAQHGLEPQNSGLTYPESFLREIRPLIVHSDQISVEDVRRFLDVDEAEAKRILTSEFVNNKVRSEFPYLLAQDTTYANITKHCLDNTPHPDLIAAYFRGIDILSHCALQYSDLLNPPSEKTDDVAKFGAAVERYYVHIDGLLGELLKRIKEDSTIIVVSDHGFEKEKSGEYHHHYAPEGIFLAAGPNILKGVRIDAPSVIDITPTILYLLDMPVAEDMPGGVIWDCFSTDVRTAKPARMIPSYGGREERMGIAGDRQTEDEIIERLRTLGYLN